MRQLAFVSICSIFFTATLRSEPALTIYNQHFAVVRDLVPVDLKAGVNEVSFNGATALAEPQSVIFRDSSGRSALRHPHAKLSQ